MNTFIANYPTLFAAFCGLGAMMVLAFGVWLVSVAKHDASIVDSFWSVMIFGAALAYARHLHLTAWSFFVDPPRAAARAAARDARDAGATISFDPGSFQMIGEMGVQQFLSVTRDLGIDILLPNKEEGAILTGGLTDPEETAAALAELYPGALVMLKLDSDGALVHQAGVSTHVPPATNNLVDATGAGD